MHLSYTVKYNKDASFRKKFRCFEETAGILYLSGCLFNVPTVAREFYALNDTAARKAS